MAIYIPSREAYERAKEEWMERVLEKKMGTSPRDLDLNLSAKCMEVLGITKLEQEPTIARSEVCTDFREIRRWVMCRAWQLYELGRCQMMGPNNCIKRAWSDAKAICLRKYGISI